MDEYYIKKRIYAMGLIVECPFGNSLSDCPLSDLRKLPLIERVGHFKMLLDEEVDEIIVYHEQCSKERES